MDDGAKKVIKEEIETSVRVFEQLKSDGVFELVTREAIKVNPVGFMQEALRCNDFYRETVKGAMLLVMFAGKGDTNSNKFLALSHESPQDVLAMFNEWLAENGHEPIEPFETKEAAIPADQMKH